MFKSAFCSQNFLFFLSSYILRHNIHLKYMFHQRELGIRAVINLIIVLFGFPPSFRSVTYYLVKTNVTSLLTLWYAVQKLDKHNTYTNLFPSRHCQNFTMTSNYLSKFNRRSFRLNCTFYRDFRFCFIITENAQLSTQLSISRFPAVALGVIQLDHLALMAIVRANLLKKF